jgi:hypothetical protein
VKSTVVVRGRRVAIAAVALFAVAGGLAYAAIPDAAGVIHACYRTSTDDQKGQLRVVDSAASCRSNESPIEWNVTGAPGAQGAAGEDGADGTSPTVAQVGPGIGGCANGGAAITDGAGATAYVCSGLNGQDGADGESFSGTFTSPNGQYSINVTDSGVTIASPDSSIAVSGGEIRVETLASEGIVVRSGGLFDLRAATSLDLRAGTTGRLESTATMTIRGSVVNIN